MKILLIILAGLFAVPCFANIDSRIVGSWKSSCSAYEATFEDVVYDIKANGEAIWIARAFKNAGCKGTPDSTVLLQNFNVKTQVVTDNSPVKVHFHVRLPDIQLPAYYHFIDFKFIFDFITPDAINASLLESTLQETGTPEVTTYSNPAAHFLTRVIENTVE